MAEKITLKPINIKRMTVTIEGTALLVQHRFSEKRRKELRDSHAGRKTKDRDTRDPAAEFEDAIYRTADGRCGVPLEAIKASIVEAAHKDIGIEKTLTRKSLRILCDDPGGILAMDCEEPTMREDWVRVGRGSTDLRYRPQFPKWEVTFTMEYNADNLQPKDILTLIDLAGFGVGIMEGRPQKGKEWGRFRVKAEDAP